MLGHDLVVDEAGLARCWWCAGDGLYARYHDEEWGRPVHCDHRLYEKICLEGFQAGLSWLTILRKREHFRAAFHDFNPERVARMGERDVKRLLGDARIIRHRGKIESTINNAKRAIELIDERGSLVSYCRDFLPPRRNDPVRVRNVIPAQTPESAAMSRDLKKHGWSFVGPTTMYAFMQAVGMVNDHLEGCHVCAAIDRDQRRAWRG